MRFILFLMVILMMAAGLACNNAARPEIKKASNPTPAATVAPKIDDHNHAAEMDVSRINLADAKKEFDAGNALFVDTRDLSSFNFARIKGAILVAGATFETDINRIAKNKKIIAYCS